MNSTMKISRCFQNSKDLQENVLSCLSTTHQVFALTPIYAQSQFLCVTKMGKSFLHKRLLHRLGSCHASCLELQWTSDIQSCNQWQWGSKTLLCCNQSEKSPDSRLWAEDLWSKCIWLGPVRVNSDRWHCSKMATWRTMTVNNKLLAWNYDSNKQKSEIHSHIGI